MEYIEGENIIYDISSMLLEDQKSFVSDFAESWFLHRKRTTDNRPCLFVFEEAHLFARYLTSKVGEQIWRIASVGRNQPYATRILSISQRASSLDTNLIEQSEVLYIGVQEGENNLRKVRAFLGKKWIEPVQKLGVGEFIKKNGGETRIVKTPLFERQTRPIDVQDRFKRQVGPHERPLDYQTIRQVLSCA